MKKPSEISINKSKRHSNGSLPEVENEGGDQTDLGGTQTINAGKATLDGLPGPARLGTSSTFNYDKPLDAD